MLALLPLGRQAIARQVAAVSIANVSVASSTFHVQMLQVSNYATSIRKTTKDTAAASTTVDVEVTVAETTKKSASTKASKKKVKATGDKDQAVNGNEKAAEKVAGEKKSKMKKKAITIMDGQTRQDDIAPVTKKKAKGGKLGMKKTKESKKEEPVSVKISPKQSVSKADAPSRTSSPSSPSLPFAPSTPPAEIDALSNYVNNPKLMRAMPTKGDNISINGSPQFEDSEGTRGQIKQQEKTAVSKTSKMSQTISAAMSPAIEAKTETSSARTLPTPAANSLASPPLRVSMLLSTKPANLKQLKPTLTGQRVALGSKGEGLVNPPPPQQQQQQQQQQEQRPSYPRTSRPSPPDPMKDPNSEEYKERYQAKKKFWTSIMVGVPVVVVTTWMLADRCEFILCRFIDLLNFFLFFFFKQKIQNLFHFA